MGMLLARHRAKTAEPEAVEESAAPAKSASKAEWVEYAEAHGHDVEGLAKADIQALFEESDESEGEPEGSDTATDNDADDDEAPEEETSGDDE